ncbi:hypothetical protein [Streptomyces sp. NRRL S-87]|uniref:hypothetical protein n=1 Tax=Streptomyces sp. NRRL S-87 TaxID=1463920 RepID=UPI00131C15AB|nr:hypothetical protein [Streptomyces sp. NRRL S-87]
MANFAKGRSMAAEAQSAAPLPLKQPFHASTSGATTPTMIAVTILSKPDCSYETRPMPSAV